MKSNSVLLDGSNFTINELESLLRNPKIKVTLKESSVKSANVGFVFLKKTIQQNKKINYGINTGFGPMANYILAHGQILELQENLILSHAVGLGEKIKDDFVYSAMVIRLNTLLKGNSGVSVELLKFLEKIISHKILPVVPEHGAVGTSGDLVQLAHIALSVLGYGKVSYKNTIHKTHEVFNKLKIKPYKLKPKEGLALINGTAIMTGIAGVNCINSSKLLNLALLNGCLALELVKAYDDSFDEKLHNLRPHKGQLVISKKIRELLKNSQIIRNRKILDENSNSGNKISIINESVQEVYSLRCLAQILGPVYESLEHSWMTTEIEMNSVTDNPIVDWKNKKFLHGGNFHGDYIATTMDSLKMNLVKLTMLSERRLNFFLNKNINHIFPPFLNLDTPGLTLGLQGLQFVATSTTAQSQTLAYPMNLHSIPTNGDNQDVVSMGTDAALLTDKVVENAFIVLAIESLALCQAVDFLKVQNKISETSKSLYSFVRSNVKKVVADRELQPELNNLVENFKSWSELNLFKKF